MTSSSTHRALENGGTRKKMENEISDFESKISSLRGLVANQRKINESLELKLQVRQGFMSMRFGPMTEVAVPC